MLVFRATLWPTTVLASVLVAAADASPSLPVGDAGGNCTKPCVSASSSSPSPSAMGGRDSCARLLVEAPRSMRGEEAASSPPLPKLKSEPSLWRRRCCLDSWYTAGVGGGGKPLRRHAITKQRWCAAYTSTAAGRPKRKNARRVKSGVKGCVGCTHSNMRQCPSSVLFEASDGLCLL